MGGRRDLFWPAPIIRTNRKFDFDDSGTVKDGIEDFDVLEDHPKDFGYITVFKLDEKFYDRGGLGGTVKPVEVDQAEPEITTGETEIFARMGYKQMNFGKTERDAYVFNKKCFENAKLRPVLVLKIINPWGKSTPKPESVEKDEDSSSEDSNFSWTDADALTSQAVTSSDTYRSFDAFYTPAVRKMERQASIKVIKHEMSTGARVFPEFSVEWMQAQAESQLRGQKLWERLIPLIRDAPDRLGKNKNVRGQQQEQEESMWDELIPLVRLHLLAFSPSECAHDNSTSTAQKATIKLKVKERLHQSQTAPQQKRKPVKSS